MEHRHDPWCAYDARSRIRGETRREAALIQEKRDLNNMLRNNLSYQLAVVDDEDREVMIVNTDLLNTKHIYSMPEEDIRHGAMVEWMENHWLVTEKDYSNEIYTKATMVQCNYLLYWVDDSNVVKSQWCIIEDGTKLRELVSVQRNLYVKISIELLETPKAHIATT